MNMFEDSCAALQIVVDFTGGPPKGPASVFEAVFREAANIPGPEGRELEIVAHYGSSRVPGVSAAEGGAHLAKALEIARALPAPSDKLESVDLVADTLNAMREFQLAIPWCNQAATLTQRNPKTAVAMLWRAGGCYSRAGFKREAQAPLRAAVKLLREQKGGLLANALLELGGACMDTEPAEAEACLQEAGAMFAAAGRMGNATIAWMNLGVVCSRNGRQDEALAWYEKVRAIRDKDPAATPAQKGNIHNNIASVWRRKGDFAEARKSAHRALEILTPAGGEYLAHALGTMGEIARDEGKDEESLDWFRRAREEYERVPSPAVDKLVTKLDNEAAALEKLGRAGEAAGARARIAELRGVEAPAAPPLPEAKAKAPAGRASDGVVMIVLDGRNLPDEVYEEYDLATLELRIETQLKKEGGGELDGHEHGPETTLIFLYGPDARALFETVAPILRDYPLCQRARVKLRQGEETTEFQLDQIT